MGRNGKHWFRLAGSCSHDHHVMPKAGAVSVRCITGERALAHGDLLRFVVPFPDLQQH